MSVVHLDKKEFERLILEGKSHALVDFWAPWCGPCRMLGPIIEEIGESAPEGVMIAKVNVDDEQDLAARYDVMSIPTVIVFRDGKEVSRSVGLRQKNQLLDMLK